MLHGHHLNYLSRCKYICENDQTVNVQWNSRKIEFIEACCCIFSLLIRSFFIEWMQARNVHWVNIKQHSMDTQWMPFNWRVLSYKSCLDTKPVLYQDRFCSLTDAHVNQATHHQSLPFRSMLLKWCMSIHFSSVLHFRQVRQQATMWVLENPWNDYICIPGSSDSNSTCVSVMDGDVN